MTNYKRNSNSGHVIEWSPENKKAAVQAIIDVSGTGINDKQTAKEEYAEVDDETAQRIRERYDELTPDPDPPTDE